MGEGIWTDELDDGRDLGLSDGELAYLSRAILFRRIECPWDEAELAERLDVRFKQLLAGRPAGHQ